MPGTEHLDRPTEPAAADRLDSWKEIASYLRRDVRTVQRWERREGLPVHRLPHDRLGSVYAFKSELDAWHDRGRKPPTVPSSLSRRMTAVAAVLLIGALGAVLWLARFAMRGDSPAITHVTQLTSTRVLELFPSMSPDGRRFVYASAGRGATDVMLRAVEAEAAVNLTADSPVDDTQPAFSPDSASIAFRSDRDGGGIFVMDIADRHVRRVSTRGYNPAWSPDGRFIAYATASFTYEPDSRSAESELWIADAVTGKERRLYAGDAMQPSWSPGGRRIAVWGLPPTGSQRDIWTIDVATGSAAPVTSDAAMDWNPVWSADGRHLYFLSDRDGSSHWNLHRVRIDETTGHVLGRVESVTLPAARVVNVALAPRGMVMWSAFVDEENIQRVAFDAVSRTVTGTPTDVTSNARRFAQPDVSADGEWLVMADADTEALYVSRSDGSERRQLTQQTGRHRAPRWSPDGTRVAFYGDLGDGHYAIWTIARDGSALTRLSPTSVDLTDPVWSRDAQLVAACRGPHWFLLQAGPDALGRPPAELTRPGGGFCPRAWSPDGSTIAGGWSGNDGRFAGFVAYDVATQRYRTIPAIGDVSLTDVRPYVSWLPDGRHLLVPAGSRLVTLEVSTGTTNEVLNIEPDLFTWPVLPRDGRYVYYQRRHIDADVWSGVLSNASR
jgi:eukaryotic-like serine/threonine-protein kinase